jgi:hypothetical protein
VPIGHGDQEVAAHARSFEPHARVVGGRHRKPLSREAPPSTAEDAQEAVPLPLDA